MEQGFDYSGVRVGPVENFGREEFKRIPIIPRGFEVVSDGFRKYRDEEITLPTQGTSGSAGSDFYCNEGAVIPAGGKYTVWTDVKAYMETGEVLLIFIRSSLATKHGLELANAVGVVDKDFYSNQDDDGNIRICFKNETDVDVYIKKGDRVAQGIFTNFLPAAGQNSSVRRTGGFGSTDKVQ